MRKRSLILTFVTLIALAIYLAATLTAAQHDEHQNVLKVGKKGEMNFDKETMVGDVMLQPGRYTFQHRVAGSEHFVRFVQVSKLSGGREIPTTAQSSEIKCTLKPLEKKAARTEVSTVPEGGKMRIVEIVVSGENVAHVF